MLCAHLFEIPFEIKLLHYLWNLCNDFCATKFEECLSGLRLFASWTAPLFVLAGLIAKYYFEHLVTHHWIGALVASWFPIVLPLAAGAAERASRCGGLLRFLRISAGHSIFATESDLTTKSVSKTIREQNIVKQSRSSF